jgi:REP element-mobilizing transposase RayT
LHHITNRGIAKRTIFERVEDVRYFLSRIGRAVRRGEIRIYSYNCMTTHFHLFAESPRGEIATAMRRIQGEYSRYFNRGRRRDGSLYRRRYFSRIVDTQTYEDNLVRYIDANAVEAGLVALPEWHTSASAYWYARGGGPPWLSRERLEARAVERCGAPAFDPDVYRRAFEPVLGPGLEEWILRRLACGEGPPDPLDDLIAAAPPTVLAWMRRKAELADGTEVGVPLVPWQAIEGSLESAAAALRALPNRDGRRCSLDSIARAGLLRDLGCLSYPRIAAVTGSSETATKHRVRGHRALLAADPEYGRIVAAVTHRAIGAIR